jgi:hypothetical protein
MTLGVAVIRAREIAKGNNQAGSVIYGIPHTDRMN